MAIAVNVWSHHSTVLTLWLVSVNVWSHHSTVLTLWLVSVNVWFQHSTVLISLLVSVNVWSHHSTVLTLWLVSVKVWWHHCTKHILWLVLDSKYRGSIMSAHVSLHLLNKLRKSDKIWGFLSILLLSAISLKNSITPYIRFYLSHDIKITWKSLFWAWKH